LILNQLQNNLNFKKINYYLIFCPINLGMNFSAILSMLHIIMVSTLMSAYIANVVSPVVHIFVKDV
jgi:hypothetical protein